MAVGGDSPWIHRVSLVGVGGDSPWIHRVSLVGVGGESLDQLSILGGGGR